MTKYQNNTFLSFIIVAILWSIQWELVFASVQLPHAAAKHQYFTTASHCQTELSAEKIRLQTNEKHSCCNKGLCGIKCNSLNQFNISPDNATLLSLIATPQVNTNKPTIYTLEPVNLIYRPPKFLL